MLALLPASMRVSTRMLVAWDLAVSFYLAVVGWRITRATIQALKRRAVQEDDGATAILALTVGAALASLAAIGAELHGSPGAEGETLRLILAAFTILCSWFFLHVVLAVHYAHESYGEGGSVPK
jgi:uncharacterized membrane protein